MSKHLATEARKTSFLPQNRPWLRGEYAPAFTLSHSGRGHTEMQSYIYWNWPKHAHTLHWLAIILCKHTDSNTYTLTFACSHSHPLPPTLGWTVIQYIALWKESYTAEKTTRDIFLKAGLESLLLFQHQQSLTWHFKRPFNPFWLLFYLKQMNKNMQFLVR